MTSPTETPPAAVSSPPPTVESGDLVIGGTRIPLPKWARFLIGILAIVGAAVPIVVTYSRSPVVPAASVKKADDTVAIQYREFQRHIAETPEYTQTLFDSPDLGSLIVKFYGTDGCLLVMRKNPGRYRDQIPYWIPAASIPSEQAPGATTGTISQSQPALANFGFIGAQMQPPTLALAGASKASVAGNCWNPHPADFRWWNGEARGCWLQVWRAWADGCQHYQWFNTCNGYWDSDQNGAPRVYWTNCVH